MATKPTIQTHGAMIGKDSEQAHLPGAVGESTPLTAVNAFDSHIYLSGVQTFFALFRAFPSIKSIRKLQPEKVMNWVEKTHGASIVQRLSRERYNADKRRMDTDNVLYVLEGRMIIDVEVTGDATVLFLHDREADAQAIINALKGFVRRAKKKSTISLIVQSDYGGMDLRDLRCPAPKLSIERHYNDDLAEVHKDILTYLAQKDKSGLFLFHGAPGTGKSTYLRYLINQVKKQVIFLSPKLAGNMDAPHLANLLLENRNSILIIEDAEDLLMSREQEPNAAVSILLNLTDGLLGESLGIQIVCTFNTSVSKLDKALLRKGRLVAMYEFKLLEKTKSRALLEEQGANPALAKGAMSLADIFHIHQKDYGAGPERKSIGFGAGAGA